MYGQCNKVPISMLSGHYLTLVKLASILARGLASHQSGSEISISRPCSFQCGQYLHVAIALDSFSRQVLPSCQPSRDESTTGKMKMLDAPRLLLTTCCLIGITFAKHPYNLLQDLERGRRVARTDGTGLLIRRADYDALPKHRFLTERTKDFAVNGSAFPEVDFDLGESYAGLVPVSKAPDETKKLFFWFWPSVVEDAPKEVVIWFVFSLALRMTFQRDLLSNSRRCLKGPPRCI